MNVAIGQPQAQPNTRNIRRIVTSTAFYVLIVLLCAVILFPLFWVLTTALKANADVYKIPPEIFPQEFHWENFGKGMERINFWRLFGNSAIIATLSTIGSVGSSMIVAYGLARIRFPGRRIWFYLFVGSMMFPSIVSLFPLLQLYINLHWYDTWLPLIVPAWFGNPFFIFLARQFYFSISRDLDEAAKIDGANHWTIFTHIMIPLTTPVWVTMMIMAFQASWNDYFNPLVYLVSEEKWTLPLGIASFNGAFAGVSSSSWNQFMAVNLLYMLPLLIIFFAAQRYFMTGLGSLGSTTRR